MIFLLILYGVFFKLNATYFFLFVPYICLGDGGRLSIKNSQRVS